MEIGNIFSSIVKIDADTIGEYGSATMIKSQLVQGIEIDLHRAFLHFQNNYYLYTRHYYCWLHICTCFITDFVDPNLFRFKSKKLEEVCYFSKILGMLGDTKFHKFCIKTLLAVIVIWFGLFCSGGLAVSFPSVYNILRFVRGRKSQRSINSSSFLHAVFEMLSFHFLQW